MVQDYESRDKKTVEGRESKQQAETVCRSGIFPNLTVCVEDIF